MLAMLLLACGELGPEDIGYEDCDRADIGAGCPAVDLCCKRLSETDVRCKYVAEDGEAYVCETDSPCDEQFNCDTEESCQNALASVILDQCPQS